MGGPWCDVDDWHWDLDVIGRRLHRNKPGRLYTLLEVAEVKRKKEAERIERLHATKMYVSPSHPKVATGYDELKRREAEVARLLEPSLGAYYVSAVQAIKTEFFWINDIVILAQGAFNTRALTNWILCGVALHHDTDTDLRCVQIGFSETGRELRPDDVSLLRIGQIVDKFDDIDFSADAVLPYFL